MLKLNCIIYVRFDTMKTDLRKIAINFRRRGLSYSEITQKVPVAKSTLSLWLRSVGLSKRQKQHLTVKKLAAALRGAEIRKTKRILMTRKIHEEAEKEIGKISNRELLLIGAMLYWAEGTKEKEEHPGSGVQFTNSDPRMIKLFLFWLQNTQKIPDKAIYFDIFIHENHRDRLNTVINYWSKVTHFPKNHFPHVYFKRNNPKTLRKNIGEQYYGLLKIKIKASSELNRKIAGWINGVVKYFNE